jgi:ATP-binding cassette, subfamily F, member 3
LPPEKLPQPLLAIDKQSAGYGDRTVLNPFSLTIAPGSRIALLGRNGAGKSTLMKLLAGELVALIGKRTEARDLRIGYFAQHQLEQLDVGESPLEHLRRHGGEAAARSTEQELRSFLGGFGFSADRVFEPVGPFSGGEKARLVLALVSFRRPNLLLLDEPTNHLDLEMRQALAVALQDYDGAVVLVAHDRHLLRAVADELILVDGGRAAPFDGDLEDYARWFLTSAAATQEAEVAPKPGAEQKKQRKREEAERRNRLSPLRAEVARCEARIAELERRRQEIETQLATPDIYGEQAKQRLQELLKAQTQLRRELHASEEAWLAATERLDAELAADPD